MRQLKDMKEEEIWGFKFLKFLSVHCYFFILEAMKDLYNFHPENRNGALSVDTFYERVFKKPHCKKVKNTVTDWPADFELNNSDPDVHKKLNLQGCLYFIKLVIFCNSGNYSVLPESILKFVDIVIKIRNDKDAHCEQLSVSDYQTNIQNLFDNIQEISNIMIKSFDVKDKYNSLFNDFERNYKILWDYDENWFTTQCPKDAKILYNNLFGTRIKKSFYEDVFKDCPEKFVKPLLVEITKNHSNHSGISINYEDIFKNNNLVVIAGEAGSGKSTLCQKLVLSFCHSQKPFSGYDLVLLIDVKNVEKGATLYQYLTQVFFKKTFHLDNEDVFCYLRQMKILFIIDDIDEKSSNSVELLDILYESFGNKHFLFTTKPNYVDDLSEKLKGQFPVPVKPLKIELRGLNNIRDISQYLKPCIPNNWENYYDLSTDLKELIKDPAIIILLLYVILHHQNKENFKTLTLTYMYIQIYKLQSETLLLNLVNGIDDKMFEIYEYCFDVCNKTKSRKFYIDKVIDVSHFRNGEQFFKSYFKPSLNLFSVEHDPFNHYEMVHESLVEFFAAFYIFHKLNDDNQKLENFFTSNIVEKHSGLISHLVGILYHKKKLYEYFDSVMSILENNFKGDYNLLWKILCQTMCVHPKPDEKLCSDFGRLLPRILELNDETIESGILLLTVTTNYFPEVIKIVLKNFLEKLNFEKVNERKELKKIKLVLKTNYQNSESSFPISLNPNWVNLIEFKGSVNNEDLNNLTLFKELETLKIMLNLDVFKTLVTILASNKMKSLKKLHLIFKCPFLENLNSFKRINFGEKKLFIQFLEEKDLSDTEQCLQLLNNIFNKKIEGAIIRLNANLRFEEELVSVKTHFKEFRNLIEDDLTVISNREVSAKINPQLKMALGNISLSWRLKGNN